MKNIPLLLAACVAFLPAVITAQGTDTVPTSAPATRTRPGLQAGDLAPDFTAVGPDGKEMKLSDFRGKTVLLDIWATWCGPCVASMPHNSALAEKHAKDGLVILAVCADDSRANYDGWVKRNSAKYKFLTAHDTPGKANWDQSVFNTQYGVSGFPTLFLIDKAGRLVGQTSGGGPGENPYLLRLLAKGGVPVDISHLPPEEKRERKSVPMMGKTMAIPASGKTAAMSPPTIKFGSLKFDDEVADFAAVGVDGKDVKLSSFKGKPVLISFWTGARSPGEDFAKLAAAYKDQGLAVWAINVGTDRAEFDTWAKAHAAGLGYTVSWDPAGKAVMESLSYMKFGIGMYPAFMVVNAEGFFRGGLIGMGPKIPVWMRQSLQVADLKLSAGDKAAVDQVLNDMFAARDKAAAAPAGGMMMATATTPMAGGGMAAAKKVVTLAAGAVAPDFVMRDIHDKEVRLSDFKGKVVILDFWATWCGPCIASMPHTNELAARYKDQDVVVLASGTSDTIAKFKEWIPRNQPKYPALQFVFDPHERGAATFEERASSKLYGVTGIPTQFVIGRDGKIVATIIGNGGKEDARTEAALALAGVKVDEGTAAKGRAALQADVEEAKIREQEVADELINPKPAFRENFGKLKAGEPPPADVTVLTAEGQEAKFSELTKGKTVVMTVWSGSNGPTGEALAFMEAWSKRYADQGMLFLGLSAYGSREDADAWRAANAGKFTFPVVSDPAGKPPSPPKPMDEMNDEEKKEFQTLSRAYYPKIVPLQFTGGAMAPVPHHIAVDPQGRMLGIFFGTGQASKDSLANLLLRAGVKVAADDMPRKVFTAEETKEKPPEARVEMLKVGALAPDFKATDAAGKEVKVSDYRGKVVILDFWATWCGPCIASMPHTQEVAAHYKDQGVVVLASCTSDDRKKFDAWVKRNQAQYPDILFSHDPQERGPDRASRKLYGVGGIPQQFIIDRDGKVVALVTGYLKGEAILDAALAQAGIKVDPALIAKGAADLKKRG
ncbi:MAG: redoxin domain-containing protein [Lacunisphaera sp.]|nr:redoxin domain-containing protein [Lacunisphaera sp.]